MEETMTPSKSAFFNAGVIRAALAGCAAVPLALAGGSDSKANQVGMADRPPAVTSEFTSDVLARPAEDEIIYFMLPDRFENGDRSNDTGGLSGGRLDHGFDPTHKGFYNGGDLKGLTSRLDYIEGMGVTAIWLGPIYRNKPVQGEAPWISAGYHGYWITDFTDVDPHLGTREDLKAFIDAAHSRGMKVYLDIITNHTADVIAYRECHDPDFDGERVADNCKYRSLSDYPYTTVGGPNGPAINDGFLGDAEHMQTDANFARLNNPNFAYTPYIPAGEESIKVPAWLNDIKYYHNRGETTFEGENSLYGDFAGLDDLMTEHPDVVRGFIDIFRDWITGYRVDGFRIDTTRHVNPNFWKQFLPAMDRHAASLGIEHFYQFGEVYEPDPGGLARFTRVDGFDQVLDFGFQAAVQDVLTGKEGTERFNRFLRADDLYAEGQATARRLPTFLGNHDMGRIAGLIRQDMPGISQDELLARTKLAHGLMMTMRGVPVIYSGDEQGFVSDGNDQDAREPLFPSRVESYNDNDLIGTDATTAGENFDTEHPLYRHIAEMSAIRKDHAALRRGHMQAHLMETDGRMFGFSRFDPDTHREYVVVANTGASPRTVNVRVDPMSETFSAIFGACPSGTNTTGNITVTVEAFGMIICMADQVSSRAGL